jgi:hypothetical protein
VQIAPPPYIVHSGNIPDGNGDTSLFVKFRAFSAPEGKGDYFVGLFLGASFPSGSPPNGLGHTGLSPMLALAKGWGPLSIQNTFNGSLPTSGANVLGRSFLWNTTFEYSIKGKIWPMIEQNSTFFFGWPRLGKEADIPDTRGCFRHVSNRRATAFWNRRRHADRGNSVPYIRPSLDLDRSFPFLNLPPPVCLVSDIQETWAGPSARDTSHIEELDGVARKTMSVLRKPIGASAIATASAALG